jgi:putative ABC transport system ATP-binding protein
MKSSLRADNISFIVPDREMPILFPMNLNILSKEFVVLLGHNGSGKSTLIKLLSGECNTSTGAVYINEKSLKKIDLATRAKDIITLTQRAEQRLFIDLTLSENITLWESRFAPNTQLDASRVLEFTGKKERFTELLDQPVGLLSGGEKQILLLALALAHPPRILFLDEHTSSLDPKASENIMEQTAHAIQSYNITTIMVTHQLEDAIRYGDRIIILKDGHVVRDQKKNSNLSISELKDMMEG